MKQESSYHSNGRAAIICIVVLLCLSTASYSQSFKRQYKDAKESFANQQYTQAMAGFNPLIAYDKENSYSEYASYYYGLSALNLGFLVVAKDMFLQIRKLYPEWEKIDDVDFLLAKIYFDQHEYFQGMLILREIKNPSILAEGETMKRHYLSQITDAETLRMVLEEYPNEVEAARALVKAISLQPLPEQDGVLFDSLISRYNFDRKKYVSENATLSAKKERYSVSLLFPFLTQTLDPSPVVKKNQFVLDLYEGMKFAKDTLEAQGIHLDLYAYDTERTQEIAKGVIALEEIRSSDLIVGPLFAEQSPPVLEFSEKYRINVINPVTHNSEFLGKDPYALLFQPSHETLGKRSAEMVAPRSKNRNCIVFYSDSPRDSVKAFNFIRRALEIGMKVTLAQEIRKETSGDIFTQLATGTEFDKWNNPTQFKIRKDSIGCIYVASDDAVIFSKVISGVEARGDSILIIGNEEWINSENASGNYATFERLQILMEAPSFVSPMDPVYTEFRRKYIQEHGTLPSDYAWQGYEFLNFVGHSLNKYGVYFQTGLSAETDPEARYNYRNSRDNQHVPFIQFRRGELVKFDK